MLNSASSLVCLAVSRWRFGIFDLKPTNRFDGSWFSDPVDGRVVQRYTRVYRSINVIQLRFSAKLIRFDSVLFRTAHRLRERRRRLLLTRSRHVGTSKNRFHDKTRFVKNRCFPDLWASRLFPLVCRKSKSTRNRRSENRRNGLTIPPKLAVLFIPYGPHVLTSLIAKHHDKRTSRSTWTVFSKIF